ncbi:MAG TPA: hypothetical protein VE953_22765 [Terriglobales bacterium]|nr:hypothetical protein [Terriglobales bacterium]
MKYTDDGDLPEVSEEEFFEVRQAARPYTVMILRAGPAFRMPGPDGDPRVTDIIMAHGKRNLRLKLAGLMPIICPIGDGSGVTGIGVFDARPEDVERIMAADPGVQAGVFTFDVHPCRSFPGSALPLSG